MRESSPDPDAERAGRYARAREILALAGMILDAAIMLAALHTGGSARLSSVSQRVAPRFSAGLFAAIGSLLTAMLSLPLAFYSGHVVERRYDLTDQPWSGWVRDWAKSIALGAVITGPLAQLAASIIDRWPRRWWLILSGSLLPISVLFANLMPVLILPLFNKFDPIDDVDLDRRIKSLAASEGISVSRVLRMDMSKQTRKANAFFTGLGRTRRIVVADTLLDAFSADEVEIVLAHELGHQVHHDIWKLIALQVPMTLGSFFVMHRAAPPLVARFGKRWKLEAERGLSDPAAFPVLALVGAGCGLLIAPIVNALVRSRVERPADLYALRLTHNPRAFISAMKKLGRMNLADPNPPRLIKWLFHDHPTLHERIELARGYEAGQ